MERIEELEKSIKEYWANRTELKKNILLNQYVELNQEFKEKLMYLIEKQSKRKEGDNQKKIKSIYLYRLLSSVYTENYEAVLGISNSDLYLDEERSETYWFPALVYKNIGEDFKEIETLLRKRFIRLEEYELFQLKKILLNEDWKLLQEIFLHLMKDSINMIIDSSLPMENELLILTGNYMDKPEILRCFSTEGDKAIYESEM